MLDVQWVIVFLTLGSLVGFIAGLLGVGGGGILVPVLSFIFIQMQFDPSEVMHLALGTSMTSIVITSLSSALAHHKSQAVDWEIVKVMSLGTLLGTFSATYLATMLNAVALAIFFSLFMAWTALKMLGFIATKVSLKELSKANMLASSTGIGAISALVAIGGGSLTVPYLMSKNINIKVAIGTSAAIGFPIAVAGSLGYILNGLSAQSATNFQLGYVYIPAVVLIALASFITAPIGARLAQYLPIKTLKKLFALLLIALSINILLILI